ncbi:hypothetical protein Sjap_010927 [Stephania japonica]|uniref:poly(A)-specific ribonuclease n=1 Tax=Stephania japonica TaxID=461633 RepID=A0AAP0JC82_9MAGN
MSISPQSESILIREVWNDNLEEEFALIREIIDDFPCVGMDTEFPGTVTRPVGDFSTLPDYYYQTLKANVDSLKVIQVGLTFSDANGNLPTCRTDKFCVWQFNFKFNADEDVSARDAIELLRQSGIDFEKISEKGIDGYRFGELLMSSGVVMNDGVHWVTFHGAYDFGYLLKLLICDKLPETRAGFINLMNMYFPTVYDIKCLTKFCNDRQLVHDTVRGGLGWRNTIPGGLNKLAELLDVERTGTCHQAGSDSLLTSGTFMKLKELFFNGSIEKYAGVLFGVGDMNGQNAH